MIIHNAGYFIFRLLPSKQLIKLALVRCVATISGLVSPSI